MPSTPASTKGAATREAILARSYALACRNGLEGLTIGLLAEQVGMSKSGVFAHFGSREDLQLSTLDFAGELFARSVLEPALKEQRGLPRLRAIFANWAEWVRHDQDGGCIFLAAASEYDDRPGAIRDRLLARAARACRAAGGRRGRPRRIHRSRPVRLRDVRDRARDPPRRGIDRLHRRLGPRPARVRTTHPGLRPHPLILPHARSAHGQLARQE
jgi:AcrR family transcriptional regulator